MVHYLEEGYSKEKILDKLTKGFSLNQDESNRYYEKFSKQKR